VEPLEFCKLVATRNGWVFPSDRIRNRVYSSLLTHVLDSSPDTIAKWKCLQDRSVIPPKYKNHLAAIVGLMEAEHTLVKIGLDSQSLRQRYQPDSSPPLPVEPPKPEQPSQQRFRPHRYRNL
jgi:hypothetical protein